MNFLTKIFGTRNDKLLNQLRPLVARINDLEDSQKRLSDDELRNLASVYRQRVANGETLDSLLPEAFATCREAARRTLGQRHFDVQVLGGIVLHQGKIAEMKTGEGKTLTATLPIFLHSLAGQGAHVVTVNDYLARRDSEWMGAIYKFLGASIGSILHGLSDHERKEAYSADITYGTNNEFGFDYLRDNMKTDSARLVQRGHNFAIVDEVDSILIDEARTPLIISGPSDSNTDLYKKVNAAIPGIQKDSDYVVDEKSRSVSLTEDGISKMEKRLNLDNIYDPKNIEWLHHIQQALKAYVIFKKDVDYVVRNGQVVIVDEFTGRLMPGRRYSDGLHGALEAKEHVQVQQETQTLATITFQNYFRLYNILSGMTGTADTEAVEFNKIYKLDVVVIPTNKILVREDCEDVVFRTAREKFAAIADDIEEAQTRGQPVLVGTVSVEKSELLSSLLQRKNIAHEVLNAKNHAREASIIAEAGKQGCVTIATNMAGRGTDIVLGEGVPGKGGLYVIGTERHESRRIDNQLRGRSGRQGDLGKSKFFLSLEDDLMRIFASDRLSAIMGRLGMKEGESIVSPMVSRAIEKAQKRVEEQNFSSRKNLIEYDDVMNQQRQVIYTRRREALLGNGDVNFMHERAETIMGDIIVKYSPETLNTDSWNLSAIAKDLQMEFKQSVNFDGLNPTETNFDSVLASTSEQIFATYKQKTDIIGDDMKKIESFVYLQIIDQAWKEHLLAMDALKDSVSLRGYAQRDPLQEYKREAFNLFTLLVDRIEGETTLTLLRMPSPDPAQIQAAVRQYQEQEAEEFDELDFSHPAPGAGPRGPTLPPPRPSAEEDKLIYHGTKTAPHRQAAPVMQTIRREGDKVGRNDPCPCGSGRKYKKCHGAGQPVQP
ncbi:MAG: preprotein translocase subunit SecA [Deltaproteobacteria bacterium]|nr:preprotein translocase subunit SecA [Deltaproteobacteria bacterium]